MTEALRFTADGRELRPLSETVAEFEGEAPGGFTLDVVTAREFSALPEPPESALLLGPFVRRGERTVIVADTGHGKTTIALQALAAVLTGAEMLGYTGVNVGPILWIDLEQGVRTIKRGLREAGLADRDDVFVVSSPDGLALDSDAAHFAELRRVVSKHRPIAVLLDPYYKAHRADDPNQERPIIDLMRRLDALRTEYQFALILTAHPRKDAPGRDGHRKLTLHDVAGSGAATRGAEVVLGLERLSHGFGRLRILKDRDGDLQVGDVLELIFDREDGFRLNLKEGLVEETLEERIRAEVATGALLTVDQWAANLRVRRERMKTSLERLAETGALSVVVGPSGRSQRARCYGTPPAGWDESGRVTDPLAADALVPSVPLVLGTSGTGTGSGTRPVPKNEPKPGNDEGVSLPPSRQVFAREVDE